MIIAGADASKALSFKNRCLRLLFNQNFLEDPMAKTKRQLPKRIILRWNISGDIENHLAWIKDVELKHYKKVYYNLNKKTPKKTR